MKKTEYYSIGKTLWKACKSTGVLGSGAVAAIALPDENAPIEQWILFAVAILPPVFTMAKNWWKHRDKPTQKEANRAMKRFTNTSVILVLAGTLAFLPVGCAGLGQSSVSTLFLEKSTDADGFVTETRFEAKSKGEVEASLHKLDYRYGGEENQIVVGQDAVSVTSPAQQALFDGWASLIANVPGMFEHLIGAIQRPLPAPVVVEGEE